MTWRISFSKFSDILPAFICASAIGILWYYIGILILIRLPFCFLLNSIIF